MNKQFYGTGVALVTPFNEDKSVDYASLEKLVHHVIQNGVEYIVALGTTAETATLTSDEKKQVVATIVNTTNKRIPLVLGIGGNNTTEVISQIQETDTSDFDAILSVCPYYNRPNQEGIYQHFKAIATSTDKKIIAYNVPSRTGANIDSATMIRIAKDFPNIIAVKEASPNFLQSTEIIKEKPSDFIVVSGDDEFSVPMTLAGGKGVISVIGQSLTQDFTNMVRFALQNDVQKAYELHYKLMDITRLIYVEGNPAGIKALLSLQGIMQPHTRLPLVAASEQLTQRLKEALAKL